MESSFLLGSYSLAHSMSSTYPTLHLSSVLIKTPQALGALHERRESKSLPGVEEAHR